MPLWRGNKSVVWIGDVLPHCVLAMRRNIFAGLSRNLGQVQTTDIVRLERGGVSALPGNSWSVGGSPVRPPAALPSLSLPGMDVCQKRKRVWRGEELLSTVSLKNHLSKGLLISVPKKLNTYHNVCRLGILATYEFGFLVTFHVQC